MRYVDRVLSVLIAAGLVVLGILIPVEIVAGYAGHSGHVLLPYERIADRAASLTWGDAAVIATGAVIGVLGLILLLAELKPRRPGVLTLERYRDDVTAGISRRSLGRVLAVAAGQVPGVDRARAALRGRRAKVWVLTPQRDPGRVADQVRRRVGDTLQSLGLVRLPKLSVRTRREPS